MREEHSNKITDYGDDPLIVDVDCFAKKNTNFRTALWTGDCLQVTLMSIPVGCDIGIEKHDNLDQFICIESGYALVKMGKEKDDLCLCKNVNENFAVIIPKCTWHNIINIGNTPLKLFSVYAPPNHKFGTVHKTKCDAEED